MPKLHSNQVLHPYTFKKWPVKTDYSWTMLSSKFETLLCSSYVTIDWEIFIVKTFSLITFNGEN